MALDIVNNQVVSRLQAPKRAIKAVTDSIRGLAVGASEIADSLIHSPRSMVLALLLAAKVLPGCDDAGSNGPDVGVAMQDPDSEPILPPIVQRFENDSNGRDVEKKIADLEGILGGAVVREDVSATVPGYNVRKVLFNRGKAKGVVVYTGKTSDNQKTVVGFVVRDLDTPEGGGFHFLGDDFDSGVQVEIDSRSVWVLTSHGYSPDELGSAKGFVVHIDSRSGRTYESVDPGRNPNGVMLDGDQAEGLLGTLDQLVNDHGGGFEVKLADED